MNKSKKTIKFHYILICFAFLFAMPVFAVPSLIPAASIFLVAAAKIAMAVGAAFFFAMSFVSKREKIFIAIGVIFLIVLGVIIFIH